MHVAYADAYGEVYSIGGLFNENKKSFFFAKVPELKFEKAMPGFFEGKVRYIAGKYSFHSVIIDS